MADTLKYYHVRGYEPPAPGIKYGYTRTLGIVCHSAVAAMHIAQEKRPSMRIDAINDRGVVDYIDPVLLVPEEITSEKANEISNSIERTTTASGV